MLLLIIFAIPKSIFISQDLFKLIKTMLKSLHVFRFISSMESLSKERSHERSYQAFNNSL